MTDTEDQFEWWRKALTGEFTEFTTVELPESGFYRNRRRDGSFAAVAYWIDDDGVRRCHLNGRNQDELRGLEIWPYVRMKPITEEFYRQFLSTGRWPDENEIAAADRLAAKSTNEDIPAPDSIDGLTRRLEVLEREAKKLIAIGAAKDKVSADAAADFANTIGNLEKTLDAKRKAEKKPFQDAGAEVDRKWNPLIARATTYKTDIKSMVVQPWLTAENKRLAQEAARAAEERRQIEEAARKANTPLPQKSVATPVQKPVTAGSFGRKVHQRDVWTFEITDRAAFLAHVKDSVLISQALMAIAEDLARSERPYTPGLRYIEGKKAV